MLVLMIYIHTYIHRDIQINININFNSWVHAQGIMYAIYIHIDSYPALKGSAIYWILVLSIPVGAHVH